MNTWLQSSQLPYTPCIPLSSRLSIENDSIGAPMLTWLTANISAFNKSRMAVAHKAEQYLYFSVLACSVSFYRSPPISSIIMLDPHSVSMYMYIVTAYSAHVQSDQSCAQALLWQYSQVCAAFDSHTIEVVNSIRLWIFPAISLHKYFYRRLFLQ